MHLLGPGKALAVYIGESDHWHGKPLYSAIVAKAREAGLAGATVSRGIMGFGANSRIHTSSIVRLSEDLPVVIYIIDTEEKVMGFLPILNEMVEEGMVATWDVSIELYRHNKKEART
jgi:PII-like signaling protein